MNENVRESLRLCGISEENIDDAERGVQKILDYLIEEGKQRDKIICDIALLEARCEQCPGDCGIPNG